MKSSEKLPLAVKVLEGLKKLEDAGMTRAEIARRIGIHNGNVSRFMNGNFKSITLDTFEKILELLNLEVRPKSEQANQE
jgi:transcriptional regulator with XRE-family HTH domain